MKKALSLLIIIGMAFSFTAFQCSSTELTSAKLYIQQKNFDKAKESLQKEVEKNPKSDEGFYLLGYVQGEEGDLKAMLESFDKSLGVSKKFAKEIDDYKKYQWQDNFNKGVGLFNRGTKVENEDSSKMFFNKSIEKFNNSILCEPDSVGAYQNMVYSLINAGRDDELEEPLKKIIELDSTASAYVDLSKVYNNQAIVLMNSYEDTKNVADSVEAMKVYDKEIALLEEGYKVHPEDAAILAQLSNAYVEANKMDVAMKTFQDGIKKDPTNEKYRYNYGVLLLGANEYEEAANQFNKAIEIKSDYTSAYYNLGVTYLKWGADMQEKAIEDESDDDSYKEKFEAAVEPLEKYLESNPEDSAIWNYLGKVYANLGETEKSKEAFDKADQYK
ncbi:MAG: tetratricopeptide repeat protein [Bacteroidota bacterium]